MPADTTKVLVTGATGTQGGAVVDALLDSDINYDVRGLTRHPDEEAAQALAVRNVTVVEGDLDDKDTLRPAVEEVDAVFCVTNFWEAGYERQVQQGKNLADVSAEAGVDHFVLSGVGSHDKNTGLPHFEAAWEIDQHVQSLDLPNTVLNPVFFMQNFEAMRRQILEGSLPMALKPDVSLQMVDAQDIGRAVEEALANPDDFIGKRYDLAGDERTLQEMAVVFTEVTNVEVMPVQLSLDDVREQMGDEYAEMFAWFNEVGYEADREKLKEVFGFTFRGLGSYLQSHNWKQMR